jgi:hypothetical protein
LGRAIVDGLSNELDGKTLTIKFVPVDSETRFDAVKELAKSRELEYTYNRWFVHRLPTGETLNLPMSPHLAKIFRALGAPE